MAPSLIYQWLWLPFIRRCDVALVNSSHTAQLSTSRGVPSAKLYVLHPGTDVPILDVEAAAGFRDRYNIGERRMLLSVGRLTQRKGLVEFVANAFPAILASFPDTLLVVIGDEATDALHARSGSERNRITESARRAGVEQSLRFLGRCDESTLRAAYQAADLHIFPVLELPGDVEGFGMVALESAAHGLPTVAFAVGGVPDAVKDGYTGTLIEPGNYVDLGHAVINQLTHMRGDEANAECRLFATGKSWAVFDDRLRNLLDMRYG